MDITKLRRLPRPCHEALSWLPFSCYLIGARMAKVEFKQVLKIVAKEAVVAALNDLDLRTIKLSEAEWSPQ